jgi:ubiquinone/menaquinone biosynthesis C-methylase UbiE
MRATTAICLLLLSAVAFPAESADRRFHDPERCAQSWDDPTRDDWQQPMALLRLLSLQEGDVVADIGAGTGYLTSRLTIDVGDTGKVYAVDVEQAMLDHIRKRTDTYQERVVTVLAEPDDPKLPAGGIDAIVILNTWHHIGKRAAYLKKLDQSLGREGRVLLVDYHEGKLPVGPPPKEKIPRAKVIKEFESAGFRLVSESTALPYQYALLFYPPERPRPDYIEAIEP